MHPPLSLTAAKELWIFWYGEEPDLSELVVSELLKANGEFDCVPFVLVFCFRSYFVCYAEE